MQVGATERNGLKFGRHDAPRRRQTRARARRLDPEPRRLPEGRWPSSTPISVLEDAGAPGSRADVSESDSDAAEYYVAILGTPVDDRSVDAAVRRTSSGHQRHARRAADSVLDADAHRRAAGEPTPWMAGRSGRSATRTTRRSRSSMRSTPMQQKQAHPRLRSSQSRARPRRPTARSIAPEGIRGISVHAAQRDDARGSRRVNGSTSSATKRRQPR